MALEECASIYFLATRKVEQKPKQMHFENLSNTLAVRLNRGHNRTAGVILDNILGMFRREIDSL